MFSKNSTNKSTKISFNTFLSGAPARDYIMQDTHYDEQIAQAANMIRNADYVLLGAGAGMSTAAGAQYGGKFFEEHFLSLVICWNQPSCRNKCMTTPAGRPLTQLQYQRQWTIYACFRRLQSRDV